MKIENLATNQIVVRTSENVIFNSYGTNIVKIENGKTFLDEKFYNYSKTTTKYRNQFLGLSTKEVEKNIKNGVFILTNLN